MKHLFLQISQLLNDNFPPSDYPTSDSSSDEPNDNFPPSDYPTSDSPSDGKNQKEYSKDNTKKKLIIVIISISIVSFIIICILVISLILVYNRKAKSFNAKINAISFQQELAIQIINDN